MTSYYDVTSDIHSKHVVPLIHIIWKRAVLVMNSNSVLVFVVTWQVYARFQGVCSFSIVIWVPTYDPPTQILLPRLIIFIPSKDQCRQAWGCSRGHRYDGQTGTKMLHRASSWHIYLAFWLNFLALNDALNHIPVAPIVCGGRKLPLSTAPNHWSHCSHSKRGSFLGLL